MSHISRFVSRLLGGLRALVRRRQRDRELDEELHAYLNMSVEEKHRAGLSPEAATQAARAALGSLALVKDHTRDVGWETRLEGVWRDLREAGRALRKAPGFSAIAVCTLGLGIGANTTIFSVISAVMLRPLPVERPDQLVSLTAAVGDGRNPTFSYAAYQRFADEGAGVVDVLAAASVNRGAITIDDGPETVSHKWVSDNYFTALGVGTAVGRTLLASDADAPVAVISHAYWTRRFGRDPSVVGRTFRFQATVFTVVGVGPPGFSGESTGESPDLWLPLRTRPAPPWVWSGHSATWLRLLARRQPEVGLDQARARLDLTYGRIREELAAELPQPTIREAVQASRLDVAPASGGSPRLRENLGGPLLVLMGLVGLVLLTACANVASLALARGAARQRETAVRLAIGAGRARVIGQRLGEAWLLAANGGAVGLGLATWGGPALVAAVSRVAPIPLALDVRPDGRVLVFTLLVSSLTAVLFGLLPAIRATSITLLPALKGDERSRGTTRFLLGRSLVAGQIALSLTLLVAAGLLTRTLQKIEDVNTGFDAEGVLLVALSPSSDASPPAPDASRDIYRTLLTRVERVPGVRAASASAVSVLTDETWGNAVLVEDVASPSDETTRSLVNAVTPRYFEAMGLALQLGRAFTEDDHERAPSVAIVNEAFADRLLGTDDPLDHRVGLCTSDPCDPASTDMMTVVGVVEDGKYVDLREAPQPMVYVPFSQHEATLREIEIRADGDLATLAGTLRRELAAGDDRLTTTGMVELRDQVEDSIVLERLVANLSAAFGLVAVSLAAVGLYGLLAYLTARRTYEIGLRMALGADAGVVRRLVMRDTFALVAGGLALGAPAAWVVGRVLEGRLFGIAPYDPVTAAVAVGSLTLAAWLAAYFPARAAARVEPLVALRGD